MRTTVGQLLVNEVLPEDMRDYGREIDKKSIKTLMRALAERHPDQYREVSRNLMTIGAEVATTFGAEASINLNSLKLGEQATKLRAQLKEQVDRVLASDADDETKNNTIIRVVGSSVVQVNIYLSERLAPISIRHWLPVFYSVLKSAHVGQRKDQYPTASLLAQLCL